MTFFVLSRHIISFHTASVLMPLRFRHSLASFSYMPLTSLLLVSFLCLIYSYGYFLFYFHLSVQVWVVCRYFERREYISVEYFEWISRILQQYKHTFSLSYAMLNVITIIYSACLVLLYFVASISFPPDFLFFIDYWFFSMPSSFFDLGLMIISFYSLYWFFIIKYFLYSYIIISFL